MNSDSDYHVLRAKMELEQISSTSDEESAARHLELASLHLERSRSAHLLLQLETKAGAAPARIWRTDKEA